MEDRRRELKQAYKETETQAGVYQIRNTVNGKIFVVAAINLKTMEGKRFQLRMGSHKCPELQADWKQYGESAFAFEVLQVLQEDSEIDLARQEALKKLEQEWLDRLQPFGERGYNRPPR